MVIFCEEKLYIKEKKKKNCCKMSGLYIVLASSLSEIEKRVAVKEKLRP